MNSIPQKTRRRHAVDHATVDRLYTEGHSYRKIAKLLESNYTAVYRAHHAPPANGTPVSAPSTPTALERTIVIGEPISAPTEYHSAPSNEVLIQRVDAHDQRLDVLEAFMQALQRHPTDQLASAPSTPEYIPPHEWKKSGVEYAVDMPDKLRAYAKAHGLQVREVVDRALRAFLAAHDIPLPVPGHGHEGAQHG